MFGRRRPGVDTRRSMAPSDDVGRALRTYCRGPIDERLQRHGQERGTHSRGARSVARAPRAREPVRQHRAEGDRPRPPDAFGDDGTGHRPARRAGPPGVLLRHPRSPAQPGRRRGAGTAGPGAGERLDREAASGRAGRPARRGPQVAQPRGRGRRDEGFARVLGLDEAHPGARRGAVDDPRGQADPQALLQGAAGVLRRPRAGGHRARRSERARADLRAQGEDLPGELQPQAGRRAVDLSRRLADRRAVGEVPAGPRRRSDGRHDRAVRVPRDRHHRRAAHQDQGRPRVLRPGAPGTTTPAGSDAEVARARATTPDQHDPSVRAAVRARSGSRGRAR